MSRHLSLLLVLPLILGCPTEPEPRVQWTGAEADFLRGLLP